MKHTSRPIWAAFLFVNLKRERCTPLNHAATKASPSNSPGAISST
jgi:hypothetical protein